MKSVIICCMYDKKVVLVDENFNIEDKAYHTYSCIITKSQK